MCLWGKLFRFSSQESDSNQPNFFVRICRKRHNEFLSIVNQARNSDSDIQDLISRIITYVLDGPDGEKSFFGIATNDPLDPGHALAVIAGGIRQDDFIRRRRSWCKCCTIIMPASSLVPFFETKHTPQHNLDFAPADDLHYDLTPHRVQEFAAWLLDAIRDSSIRHVILANEGKTYLLQARIAYSACLARFGSLSDATPEKWRNGKNLTASEQVSILRYLANPEELCSQ